MEQTSVGSGSPVWAWRQALNPEQKRVLAAFFDECLDGSHAEDELLRLWKSTGPQKIVQPVVRFFENIRSRLRDEDAPLA